MTETFDLFNNLDRFDPNDTTFEIFEIGAYMHYGIRPTRVNGRM